MLRVAAPPTGSAQETGSSNSFFSLDKRKKQVTLIDPSACGGGAAAPEDRRLAVAAPKMFAFDAVFSQDDSQVGNSMFIYLQSSNNGLVTTVCFKKLRDSREYMFEFDKSNNFYLCNQN